MVVITIFGVGYEEVKANRSGCELGHLVYLDNATDEAHLEAVGIHRARVLATVLPDDAATKSVQQRYPKESHNKYQVMRNILSDLEDSNETDITNNIISNLYSLKNAVDKDNLDEKKAKELLKEFRETVGDDPIEKEIERRKKQEARQQRGYRLEELFCDLLQLSELEYSRPFKTPDGEQIDGHFRYEKFDYLIESKWGKRLNQAKRFIHI